MTFEPTPLPDEAPTAPGADAVREAPAATVPGADAVREAPAAPGRTAAAGVPAASSPPQRDGGGLRLVVASATLSALLAVGGTSALLLATLPEEAPTATPPAGPVASAVPATTVVTRVDGADAVAAVAAATEPSVVAISGSDGRFVTASGSGFIVSASGLILTTTIVAPTDIRYDVVLADQRRATARVVATDAVHGLVLLQADATGLAPVQLGGPGAPTVGQLVVAVGSPLVVATDTSLGTFTATVTSGIVSGLDRSIDLRDPSSGSRVALEGLIQTDAAINAGSSGGPLLDAAGAVVGIIATSATDGQGIGFAIPIADALDLIARAEA
jgi:putative serine protease PepD